MNENPMWVSRWSLRDEVFVELGPGEGTVVVRSRSEDTTLRRLPPAVVRALRRMTLGPIALSNVINDRADWETMDEVLDQLRHLVVRAFGFEPDRHLLSVVPLTPQARFRLPDAPPIHPVRLSRFATIRTDGSDYLIESPLSLHRVILHGPEAMSAVGTLIRPAVPSVTDALTQVVVIPLLGAGLAVRAGSEGPFDLVDRSDDADSALIGWTPAGLQFHTRSTLGRHDHDFGAIYPIGESAVVEPVVKPPAAGRAVVLPGPNPEDRSGVGQPLVGVIERSRSSRHFSVDPMTIDELGTLLYRTARVRSLVGEPTEPSAGSVTSDRPYSSTGRSYELEIYATVDRCQQMPRGVYHYDPLGHRLELVSDAEADIENLLDMSRVAADLSARPAVLFTITARFRRVSLKYGELGYSLVLRNFGALTQLLTLVCAALGLTGRRIDCGEIEVSSRILGLDWRTESSVGSFALGRPADRPQQAGGASGQV